MTNINFDSEDLKVDYLSFNLQFNNPEQIQKIAGFLADTLHCRSTLLDQSSKKRHLLTETNKNRYSAEFVVNSSKHWKGSILRFRGRHAQWFYKDLKFQKLDWSIFDFEETNLGRVDLCYDRKLKASDMPDLKDKLQTPIDNLRVAKEYLKTSQSDIQYRARAWEVLEDVTTISIASEIGGDVGAFGAGAASNKIADGYMNEMVMTEVTKSPQEKLNLEMFKQTAREQGKDVSKVRGTGLMRQYVPEFMQEDVCERPERNSRPDSWEDSTYSYEDPSSFN